MLGLMNERGCLNGDSTTMLHGWKTTWYKPPPERNRSPFNTHLCVSHTAGDTPKEGLGVLDAGVESKRFFHGGCERFGIKIHIHIT